MTLPDHIQRALANQVWSIELVNARDFLTLVCDSRVLHEMTMRMEPYEHPTDADLTPLHFVFYWDAGRERAFTATSSELGGWNWEAIRPKAREVGQAPTAQVLRHAVEAWWSALE